MSFGTMFVATPAGRKQECSVCDWLAVVSVYLNPAVSKNQNVISFHLCGRHKQSMIDSFEVVERMSEE